MNDTNNKTIEELLLVQIEAQQKLLEATERKAKLEAESIITSQMAIKKHDEAIAVAVASKNASDKLITTIEKLIIDVQNTVIIAKPLDNVINKIDILIQILQLLVQIINQLSGVSKDNLERLQDQLYKLAELNAMANKSVTIHQSTNTVGSMEANQANISENLNTLQRNIHSKEDKVDI